MRKRIINLLIICLVLFSSITYGQNQIKIQKIVLDNGLTVFLNEDHSKSSVFGAVVTKAGGKNDPEGATGMAHYQEHMLFKGTKELGTSDWEKEKPHIDKIFELYDKLGETKVEEEREEIQKQINEESIKAGEYAIPNEMDKLIKNMGGTKMNAGTGPDKTIFYNTFPPSEIEKWIDLYAHRFEEPVFRSFQAELEVVYEEKNMYSDMFIFNLIEKFNYHFFKNHPYGQQTLIGTVDELKNPSLTKMYKFFKTYYVANNMGLVLSGNFNSEEIIPLIKNKFGKWKSGEVPPQKVYKEEVFKGRELVEAKLSPVKLGLLGFRTVPNGDKDQIALDVTNFILSNSNQTGLIDQLAIDNKILTAQVISMPYNDHGATLVLFVPKIIGQKLEDAEDIIMKQIALLKKGNFDDWMLDAAKNSLYKDSQLSLETNDGVALKIVDYFGRGQDVNDIFSYGEQLKLISKEDIIAVANKYYGDNYLAFYSKMGFAKGEKIDKPGYKPVKGKTNRKSEYAEKLDKIPSKKMEHTFVDFEKDIQRTNLQNGVELLYNKNTKNDIFSASIKFGIGNHELPLLDYASQAMNYVGTDEYSLKQLKAEFSKIGCNYYISSNDSYLYINFEGIEENKDRAFELINGLINTPKLNQDKINNIIDGVKAERKLERSEPASIGDALFDYVKYGEKSDYLDRLSMKEIKALQASKLVDTYKKALSYESKIHFVGKSNFENVQSAINQNIKLTEEPLKSLSPIVINPQEYNTNKVFFVNKKKAVQSKVYLFCNGKEYSKDDDAIIAAFNMYFGGGFSGIVLQEVREYRSLAYSAGARFNTPKLEGKQCNFTGFVGTQADKTNDALEIFDELIRDMPQKSERIDMIKPYLINSISSSQPDFRDLSEKIEEWEVKGYKEDPAKTKLEKYNNLEFADIVEFYNTNIKDKPFVIAIVGNKKKIDIKKLEKYGEIVKIKEKDLFSE